MLQRTTLLLLIGIVLFGTLSVAGFADEDAAKPAKAGTEAKDDGMSMGDVQTILDEHPGAKWILILGRILPLILGVGLLVWLYLRQDKIRGGVIPADQPNPPPLPYQSSINLYLAIGGLAVVPLLIASVWKTAGGALGTPESMLITGISALPVAILVVLRRHRLSGERIPRTGKALGLGLGAFCIALVAVIPLTLIWAKVLMDAGHAAPAQDLVKQAAFSVDPFIPISIAVFGILIAPFIEEAIFRGLLYPTFRKAFGGGKRGVLLSATVTSIIFAAMHGNLVASIGLFSLAFVLALVYEKTNSLAAVVVAHATNNLFTLVPLLMVRFG